MVVQRLQHQAVAPKRDHHLGEIRIGIAIEGGELRQRGLGLGTRARDEGDPLISLGRGHASQGSLVGCR